MSEKAIKVSGCTGRCEALNHSQVARINRNLKEALDQECFRVLSSLGETGQDAERRIIEVTCKET